MRAAGDTAAVEAAEDLVTGLVAAENRAVAARCGGVFAVFARHEDLLRQPALAAGVGRAEWERLDPFAHACQSVVAACGVTQARATAMVLLAVDTHTWARPVLDALASGAMCERIAMLLCDKARATAEPEQIIAVVVADYLDRLRSGQRPSRQAISGRAGRIIAELDPDGVAERKKQAAASRSVRFRPDEHDMCTMTARLTSAAGAVLAERIDAFARTPADGDTRSLAQRRADALVALATGEHLLIAPETGHATAGPSDTTPTGATGAAASPATSDTAASGAAGFGTAGSVGRACACGSPGRTGSSASGVVGVAPVLRPRITIIATGAGEPRVEFARTGTASVAMLTRLLAQAHGASVEIVGTAPGTHDQLGEPARYRIPAALARRVRDRDGTCRHPGCHIPAQACDVDHIVPFNHARPAEGGLTIETNLMCLCRRHHRYKTFTDARYQYAEHGRIRIQIGRHTLTTDPTGPLGRARTPARTHITPGPTPHNPQQRHDPQPPEPHPPDPEPPPF